MNKEQVPMKKQTSAPTIAAFVREGDAGLTASINSLEIPRILLCQSKGHHVEELQVAKAGDIIDAMSNTKLGDRENKISFTVLKYFRQVHRYELSKNDAKARKKRIEIVNGEVTLPYEEDSKDGKSKILNQEQLRFYILLNTGLGQDASLPYLLTFKGASRKAGKQLYTTLYQNSRADRTMFAQHYELSCVREANKEGETYWAYTVSQEKEAKARYNDPSFAPFILKWADNIDKFDIKVDENVDDDEPATVKDVSPGAAASDTRF